MTIDRDAVVSWLIAAPPAVLLSLLLGLAGWVWALEGVVSNQSATVAATSARVLDTQRTQILVDGRLSRLESKADVMMEILIEMRETMRRIDKEHERLIP